MRLAELILQIAAAFDDAAAEADAHGFTVRMSASLPLRIRFRRDRGASVTPERAERQGSIRRNAARLIVKRGTTDDL